MSRTESRGLVLDEKLLFERTDPGRIGYSLPDPDVPAASPPAALLRDEITDFPEISEVDVVRHYTISRPGTTGSTPVSIRWAAVP